MKGFGWLVILGILALGTGLAPVPDLEDRSYALAVMIKKEGQEYRVGYSVADYAKASSDAGTKIPSTTRFFVGKSLRSTRKMWKTSTGKPLHLGHVKVIILQEKVDQRIRHQLWKDEELSKGTKVVWTKKSFQQIVKEEKNLQQTLGETIEQQIGCRNKEVHQVKDL